MNLDKSLAFYKDRFADASDFTFVLRRQLRPADDQAAGRAVPGQPAGAAPQGGRTRRRHPPAAGRRREGGHEGQHAQEPGRRRLHRAVPEQPEEPADHPARWRTRSEGNLQRVLREDLGGTYGVSVAPEFTKRPTEEYRVTITFACDPARTQDLVKALFAVIEEFKTTGPSAGQVADAQAGAAAGSRNRQPAERLPAESARLRLSVRRAGPGPGDAARALRSADGADAARRGAHVPGHEPLREGGALAGDTVGELPCPLPSRPRHWTTPPDDAVHPIGERSRLPAAWRVARRLRAGAAGRATHSPGPGGFAQCDGGCAIRRRHRRVRPCRRSGTSRAAPRRTTSSRPRARAWRCGTSTATACSTSTWSTARRWSRAAGRPAARRRSSATTATARSAT